MRRRRILHPADTPRSRVDAPPLAWDALRYPAAIAAVMAVVLAAFVALRGDPDLFIDAKAFYCAGHALDAGLDPYLNGSLLACERGLHTFRLDWRGFEQLTLPAPLPPVAILPFALLAALLPYGAAVWLWAGLNVVCAAVAADRLRRALPSLPPMLIAALVVVSAVAAGIRLGQPTGIELLAVVSAGLALRDRSAAGIAGWLAVAALQPHVALPLGAALLFAPGRVAWRPVALVAVAFAAVSAGFGALTLEYVRVVVPAHASANLPDVMQLAVPSVLAALGVPAHAALLAGDAFYLAAAGVAVVAGRRVAAAAGRPEGLPWLATMIGTLAAPHLHMQQITCVLPGALLLVAIGPARRLAHVALYAVAVPWVSLTTIAWGPAFALGAAAAAWHKPAPRRLLAIALLAGATLAVACGMAALRAGLTHPAQPHPLPPLAPGALAEETWRVGMLINAASLGTATLPARAVTWLAGLLLAGLAVWAALRTAAARLPEMQTKN